MHAPIRNVSLLVALAPALAFAQFTTVPQDSTLAQSTLIAADALAKTPGTQTAPLNAEDRAFFEKAAIGGLFEVRAGGLARKRAEDPEVKSFGNRMLTDHGKANDELKQLAKKKALTMPSELDGETKRTLAHLETLSGNEFDRAYVEHMVDDHQKDVKEFERASAETNDPDLRRWAQKTLPVLQRHLELAKHLQTKLE
jgi:putative membrane protein